MLSMGGAQLTKQFNGVVINNRTGFSTGFCPCECSNDPWFRQSPSSCKTFISPKYFMWQIAIPLTWVSYHNSLSFLFTRVAAESTSSSSSPILDHPSLKVGNQKRDVILSNKWLYSLYLLGTCNLFLNIIYKSLWNQLTSYPKWVILSDNRSTSAMTWTVFISRMFSPSLKNKIL